MKKLFTLFAVAAMAFAAQANVLVVADGEYQSSGNPVYGLWFDTPGITQQIYPADMLTDMAGGQITEITFTTIGAAYEAMGYTYDEVYDADYRYYMNFDGADVYLALMETNELGFEEAVAYVGATLVATATPVEGTSELTFVLDEPFQYNGGNLLMEVTYDGTGNYGTTYFWGMGMVDDNDNILYYPSYYGYENYSGTLNGNISGFLPMATFTYEEGTPEPTEKTADPSISAVAGNQCYTVTLENNAADPEATLYISINGEEFVVYTEPIILTEFGPYNITAYAQADGKLPSNNVGVMFTIDENTQPDLTAVSELNGQKAVAGVRYFNMAGQEMQQAEGLTIVVTTYTDGTTSAVKVVK